MAVYLTKSMLSKLNKVQYPCNWSNEDDWTGNDDPWQKLIGDGKLNVRLAKEMICRVCARNGCTPLTEKIDGYDVISAICSITNVSINTEDSLPKYICTDCLETLKIAMIFKKNCETSDRKFKQILNPMGDPSVHSYPYSKHDFQLILHQMKQKRMKIEEKRERERKKREKILEKKAPKTKQFTCSPCDMVFPNKEKLMTHRRERQCMRRACELCGQLVLSIAQHMRHIHKQSVLHKCPTCGKEFPVIARLKNHMLVHTDTFNFFCDLCPYKCKHKYYLVMHMRTHTGEKPYKCAECPATFVNPSNLNKHKLTHQDKQFKVGHKYYLGMHMRTHTGEKPYKCAECPATFVNPSNLNKHKLTHQDKQFKCVLCEKAFRTTSALREHHEATHMNIKHTCNYCGRDFCYKSDLRKHEIRSHNRTKRDYIGGEPTYKQVERMQKIQENQEINKWHQEQIRSEQIRSEQIRSEQIRSEQIRSEHIVTQTVSTIVQAPYIDQTKDFMPNHQLYFSDVTAIIQQPQLVQQQPVQLSLPELTMKKDEVKIYETPGIGYF